MWLWSDWPKPIYLSIKAKGVKKREWVEWSNWNPVIENYKAWEFASKFSWDLVGIKVKEADEKFKFAQIQMIFLDGLEKYIVSSGFTWLATSILNSFAWAMKAKNNFKNVTISLYMKNDYPAVGLFFDGDMCNWAWDWKDLNAMTKKVKINWQEATDREELNEWLRGKIIELDTYLENLDEDRVRDIDEIIAKDDNTTGWDSESKKDLKNKDYDDDDLPF